MDLPFEQMYQQLSEEHRPCLEIIRKSISIVRKLPIAVFLCTLFTLLLLWLLPLQLQHGHYAIALLALALIILVLFGPLIPFLENLLEHLYVLYFRRNVAKNFVALVDPSLSYSPEPAGDWHKWILKQYHTAQFDGRMPDGSARPMVPCRAMGSPGLSNFITGKIEERPFRLCCMYLQEWQEHQMKFEGLFVSMKVSKNLNGFIKVQRKVLLPGISGIFGSILGSIFGTGTMFIPETELQKMDKVMFEKDFLVGSNDQLTAMQYLTADVMELLLNFKNELIDIQKTSADSTNLDFFWQGDDVLMRIGNRKMFKPTMHDPMCKDSLACCVSTLRFVTKFNQVITKSIKETAI